MPPGEILRWTLKFLPIIALLLAIFYLSAVHHSIEAREQTAIDNTDRREITWDFAVESANHGFEGTLDLTKIYGKNNLTPEFDVKMGPSDWLYPTLLQDSLCMYKITRNETYLVYARLAADSIKEHMLNDIGIIRMYSYRKDASDTEPTDLNYYLLSAIAELAIYDPSYKPLAEKVAYGIVNHGLSDKDIPYGTVYPNGTVADTISGLPSNGGRHGTISVTVMGLLRAYQATGNTIFLNKSRSILVSVWNHKRTKINLVPAVFDSVSLKTIRNDTQLYATGELLTAYIYYYYITNDPQIKSIISDYSSAAYDSYWDYTPGGQGYFDYTIVVDKEQVGRRSLETNWHKLDMSLIYAGEITGRNYLKRIYQDMDIFWLGKGLAYVNHLFRHATNPDGSPGHNTQSLIYSSFRTANYVMLRMLNQGIFDPANSTWNEKIWEHVNATWSHHYHKYGYHTDIDVETFKPDAKYYGLSVVSACDEFSSLVTLIFHTTPNVKMAWEIFPKYDYSLEPFSIKYSDDVAFMDDVFMDYPQKEIAFKKVVSERWGKIYCSQNLSKVVVDGQAYNDWHKNVVNTINGSHEYILIFDEGSYIPPMYPSTGVLT